MLTAAAAAAASTWHCSRRPRWQLLSLPSLAEAPGDSDAGAPSAHDSCEAEAAGRAAATEYAPTPQPEGPVRVAKPYA